MKELEKSVEELVKPINLNINEDNSDKNEWIACGASDVCDVCQSICDPSFH